MIIFLLLAIPLVLALLLALFRCDKIAGVVVFAGAVCHSLLCALLPFYGDALHIAGSVTLHADRDGFIILGVTSMLFLLTSLYLCFWLPQDEKLHRGNPVMKRSKFGMFLLIFLFTMTLTSLAQDFGMLWVAVEATTLASAPLIDFHRSKRSLEAMWKYLLICSIGIGLALFGTMLIAASMESSGGLEFRSLMQLTFSGKYNPVWFKAGFVLCFAGYGLKMGLAPFHTWLPDAYSESASPVSALLSGALINCSLLAIIRLWEIVPSPLMDFCGGYLKFFGFFSLAAAAFFIINQKDFKRVLAYSSVEHMGVISLLLVYGLPDYVMLHVIAHSLLKMSLFLLAGNIILSYRTRSIAGVSGVFTRLPGNGSLWIFGLLLICGTPPSPLFFTELSLVRSAGLLPGAAVLLLLLVIFCGMGQRMLQMCAPGEKEVKYDEETEKLAKIPALAITLVTLLGIAVGAAWLSSGR